MNMEDEIRRQKERLRAEQKQQERDEVFKRELWAHGFGPLSPLLVCPFDKLKTIVDEAQTVLKDINFVVTVAVAKGMRNGRGKRKRKSIRV